MLKTQHSPVKLAAGDYQVSFLPSGDIFEATYKSIMINQVLSNQIDGSMNNIYLRIHRSNDIRVYPLLGVQSTSKFGYAEDHVTWKGTVEGITYQVQFYLTELGVWFWDIQVDGNGEDIDIIYGQDLGIADEGAIRNNEAYVAQYLDHQVFADNLKGYVICSRQNQQQSTGNPYIQQGALTRTVGYSTDGFQFFGKSYKETNQPEALTKPTLANEIYQYEFAYTALQSEKVQLAGKTQFVFYGLFQEDHAKEITELEFEEMIDEAWKQANATYDQPIKFLDEVKKKANIGKPLSTKSLTMEEIDHLYPRRHQEEWDGNILLSFFTDTYEHIVLKEKELAVERPHGHILMTGNNERLQENTLTTTSWMYGIFNAQLVVGNTNFNKFITNARNPLNILKTSGQRIYVEMDGVYHILALPSVFEIGFNYARWYYKMDDETFKITTYTTLDTPEVRLDVQALSGKEYRYLMTNQVVMHPNEYEVSYKMERAGSELYFSADETAMSASVYPDLSYCMHLGGTTFEMVDDQKLVRNGSANDSSLVICELAPTNKWHMTIQGLLHGEELSVEERDFKTEVANYRDYYHGLMNGFSLTKNGDKEERLNKLNTVAWWYTHNMLVHFSVPHGLEQYSGAAWGTRDVCQGPTEYFMATQNYESVKEIIKTVYTHQFEEDGNWPQWFMFDKYFHIQAGESHGDIIVWPLKVLADYLETTKDYQILQEKVPYTKRDDAFQLTEETATIYEHAKKEIQYIKDHFLHDTYLSSYGDGDWDDTLQPANSQLKQYMVSSWTVALTYQVMDKLAKVFEDIDQTEATALAELAAGIEKDFRKYMLQTDVIPGFIYMENPEKTEMMLHPEDTKTGIDYRLLPMQRGIISELLTPEQAEQNYQLIKEKLYFPDGVRLMNRPANYTGGVSTHFKRAEQAANFGREIGLQYVHAHIRFVEAMAKLGKADEAWKGLETINPVGIRNVVNNAEIRQSNTYFSSSDGKFNTRYDAQENFDQLRDGSVAVKGGWRIYSSGPGIYMNQLISNCLGIRQEAEKLVIDPVLPESFDGLTFEFTFKGYPVTFVYHLGQEHKRVEINQQPIEAYTSADNRYRQGGFRISQAEFEAKCKKEKNVIDIYL